MQTWGRTGAREREAFSRLDRRLEGLPAKTYRSLLPAVSEIEATRGWWEGRCRAVSCALRDRREEAVAESAEASIKIAWSRTPRLAATPWSSELARKELDARRAGEVAGYAEVLRRIHGCLGTVATAIGEKRVPPPVDPSFSGERIRSHHDLLLRHGGSIPPGETPGQYRSGPSDEAFPVGGIAAWTSLRPRDADDLPSDIDFLSTWTVDRLTGTAFPPLFVVAAAVMEFLSLRPFRTGNGRLSRLLTAELLLRAGHGYIPYAPLDASILSIRAEYYVSFRKSQSTLYLETPDLTAWLVAFLTVQRRHGREVRARVDAVPDPTTMSANQEAALRLMRERGEVATRDVAEALGVSRETAKRVLSDLIDRNAAVRHGKGRAARCRVAATLQGGRGGRATD